MNAPAPTEPDKTHSVYVSLGSNIEPEANLPRAVALLRERSGLEAVSAAYRSTAVGASGPEFLNAAAHLRTPLDQSQLKAQLRQIEKELGRQRGPNPNAPRPIDLDILLFDGQLMDEDLWRMAHLALPLSQLYPQLPTPGGEEDLRARAEELRAQSDIERLPNLLD